MKQIDWKKKLTSRKFWVSLAAFVAMLIAYFGGAQAQADKTTALIMAGATVIAYIIGEGLEDSYHSSNSVTLPLEGVQLSSLIEGEEDTDDEED